MLRLNCHLFLVLAFTGLLSPDLALSVTNQYHLLKPLVSVSVKQKDNAPQVHLAAESLRFVTVAENRVALGPLGGIASEKNYLGQLAEDFEIVVSGRGKAELRVIVKAASHILKRRVSVFGSIDPISKQMNSLEIEVMRGELVQTVPSGWQQIFAFVFSWLDERTIRHAVVGRKNYYGSGSHTGADTAATLFTIIESCKKNDLHPRSYLQLVLQWIADGAEAHDIRTPLEQARLRVPFSQ